MKTKIAPYIEVAKVSGLNLLSIFYRVAIPLARPALIGGVILVMMETLADFGVADYLGIETFTTVSYTHLTLPTIYSV